MKCEKIDTYQIFIADISHHRHHRFCLFAEGLIPGATDVLNGKQTNTLIYQVTRRKETWTDDNLEHHHQEADVTIVL